jgi:hypothetical protein
MACKYIYKGK